MRDATLYPMNEGTIVAGGGLSFSANELEKYIREEQVDYSNALQARLMENPYLVGPLARYSLNFDRFSPEVRQLAIESGLTDVCRNPFQSILVRALETAYACEEAIRLVRLYERPEQTEMRYNGKGTVSGAACIEAPRGILYHFYELDAEGHILKARIIPPTSQNQKMMEQDVRDIVIENLHVPEDVLQQKCEQTIRNYDPCISCATHFLRLKMEQS
jgi:coenzyme F420-reducing hydrogenase alpha subunit